MAARFMASMSALVTPLIAETTTATRSFEGCERTTGCRSLTVGVAETGAAEFVNCPS